MLARCAFRDRLAEVSRGRSIIPVLNRLDISDELRQVIAMQKQVKPGTILGNRAAGKAKKKLEKLCAETKV